MAFTETKLRAVDPEALMRLERFGGAKLLREMIGIFLRIAPERLDTAAAAVADGDVASAGYAMHSLKSSSAQLGAMKLSQLCEQGEVFANGAMVTEITKLLVESRAELVRVRAWLIDAREARCS